MEQKLKINCDELLNVITKELPSMYGATAENITVEKAFVVSIMQQHGWKLIPGFYGDKTDEGVKLKPNLSWFMFIGQTIDEPHKIFQYLVCINYKEITATVYNSERLIGVYPSLEDMFNSLNLKNLTPINIEQCTLDVINSILLSNLFENVFFNEDIDFSTINKNEKLYSSSIDYRHSLKTNISEK
mgnify:CR=1 FL=1